MSDMYEFAESPYVPRKRYLPPRVSFPIMPSVASHLCDTRAAQAAYAPSGCPPQEGSRTLIAEYLKESSSAYLALFAVIAIAIWVTVRIRARYRDNEDPAAVDHIMLTQMGELHRQGDLSEEEYRSIKSRLIERIDDSTREQKEGD